MDHSNLFSLPEKIPKNDKTSVPPNTTKKKIDICGEQFLIDQHYEINKLIGKGTYGLVAKGMNLLTGQEVAIKKMSKLFQDLTDTKRILREIRILKFLKNKNIIELADIMTLENEEDFNEVYLVFEFMTSNLAHVINKLELKDVQIKRLMYHLLSGLYYMHSANIIHRDIKPENLLVNKKCELKIADLNLATKKEEGVNCSQTEWYRAPEVLLCYADYTNSIDIWSTGCILAELVGRTPLFKGQDYLDQFSRIATLMGVPGQKDFDFEKDSSATYNLNMLLKQIKKSDQEWNGVKWTELYTKIDPLCADLLNHMLVYNPRKRYTVEECLKHPYFKQLYESFPPEKCQETIDWSFDTKQYSEAEMRSMFVQEIKEFRNTVSRKESLKREHEGELLKTSEEDLKRLKKDSAISADS